MFISITKLEVKSIFALPMFYFYSLISYKQIKKSKGQIFSELKQGKGRLFYTLSAWESKKDMINYRNNGSHLKAMKITKKVASKASSTNFFDDQVPSWDKAIEKLNRFENKYVYD